MLLSLSILLLIFIFLIDWDPKKWFANWKDSPLTLPIVLFFGLHVAGLVWTTNFTYAAKDLSNKVIFFIVPLMFIAKPPTEEQRASIFQLFITSILLTSLYNLCSYWQLFGKHPYDDIRGLSLFSSHIRYALLILAAFLLTRELNRKKLLSSRLHWVILIYLIGYTLYSQVLIGWLGLLAILIIELLIFLREKWNTFQITLLFSLASIIAVSGLLFLLNINEEQENINNKKHSFTVNGNSYEHITHSIYYENGVHYMQNVCYVELRKEWNKVSSISFDGRDKKGQPICQTIIRYMSSKNLLKDSLGVSKLLKEDIERIENGITKPNQSVSDRLQEINYQLKHREDPNGHSILQRIEHWRAACFLIQKNWLYGVGTGDVQDAFDDAYNQIHSTLLHEHRNRAHNYYFTSWITFGISGIFVLLFLLYRFGSIQVKKKSIAGFSIFILIALSMVTEDTPETEVGICMMAMFMSLFDKKFSSS